MFIVKVFPIKDFPLYFIKVMHCYHRKYGNTEMIRKLYYLVLAIDTNSD